MTTEKNHNAKAASQPRRQRQRNQVYAFVVWLVFKSHDYKAVSLMGPGEGTLSTTL